MRQVYVRIELRTGRIKVVAAVLTDWIDDEGNQSTTATYKERLYVVVRRDGEGAVFGRRK